MLVAIFAGLYYTLASSGIGYTLQKCLKQPIMMALPLGIILGDVEQAMIIGAALEMCYVGIMAPGGSMPADEALAAAISIPLAVQIGADTGTAVLIAAPLAMLGVVLDPLRKILDSRIAVLADKYVHDGNEKGLSFCAYVYGILINFVLRFPIVFIAVYFGQDVVEPALNALPAWITNGMSVAGGVLPALGFALILFLIAKPSVFPFFFLGFFACKYLGLSVLSAAFFAIPIAVAMTLISVDSEKRIVNNVKKLVLSSTDDDEDDE